MSHLLWGVSLWYHGNSNSRYVDKLHHPLRCGIVVYLVDPRHLFHSIPLDVCFVSQLERCFYVSFRKLILWSLRWSIIVELPLSSCLMKVSKAKTSRSIGEMNRHLREGQLDHEDCVSFASPLSSYLMSWISGRDSCLVGVSYHSPSLDLVYLCISIHASCLNFMKLWNGGWSNPSTLKYK